MREVREDAATNFSSSYVSEYLSTYDTNFLYVGGVYYVRYAIPTIIQGSQTRWQQLDSLGRVTQDQQPESGLTTFTYDDAGRAVTKTDSRGIVTTTTYDEINRPLAVTFSDSTPGITYTYDVGTYGIGRLRSITNGVATSTYTYNSMGQVTREDKTINGVAFYTTYGYNLAGQVTTSRLPNGTILTNNYDTVGRLASLTSDWVDGNHPATLASSFVYSAAGAVTQVDFGNSTRMTRTFNSGLQLKTLRHGTAGLPGAHLDLEYNYEESVSNNGRIMGITNYNDRTKDLTYTYDRLYRLATAQTAGSHWGLSWTYDRYGNRLTQSITKGTGPTSSLTYSDTTNRVNGWTYDDAGNTLNDGRHTYTWNGLNQQTSMDGTGAQYRYDAQGNRVMKITPAKTTYYVLGTGEYSNGVWEKLYVSLNGQKLVEYSNSTTYFFHCDHLGTPRKTTDLAGQVVETWNYYPFGEQYNATGGVGNRHRYTGKERDPESANDYFGARYYFAGNARWLSVDPVAGNMTDPQVLNRYRYCRNDPINLFDPDGRHETGAPHLHGPNDPNTGARKPHPEDQPPLPIPLPISWSLWNVASPGPPPQAVPGSGWTPPGPPDSIPRPLTFEQMRELVREENSSGLSDELVMCIAFKESSFRPWVDNKSKGWAAGLMGLTAPAVEDVLHSWNVDVGKGRGRNSIARKMANEIFTGGGIFDPGINILLGTSYLALRVQWAKGDVLAAVMGYGDPTTHYERVFECEAMLLNGENPKKAFALLHKK